MKKYLLPLFAVMTSIAVFDCSDTKIQATDKMVEQTKTATESAENAASAEESNVVQIAKTITLANGAKVTWIQDNQGEKLNPRSLFSDASDSLFASLNLPDGIPASVSVFLLQADGKNILFDAGLGAFGGQMLDRLAALYVTPEEVDLIYLTHFHVDHIAGMIAKDSAGKNVKVFNNATVYAGKVEYDAWMNDILDNDLQKSVMEIYKDKLQLFAFGDSLPHGVLALDAVGHTPGHTAFQFSNLLVVGDLMHGYALQKDHPEINSNYDMDKEKSIESRKRLMQYARDNKLTMAGMHLPPPGFAE